MRKKFVIGNWKMNLNLDSAQDLVFKIKNELNKNISADVGLCPPAIYIPAISQLTKGTSIQLGCQNIHFEEKGAFTGEIAISMLKDFSVDMVLVGHSERREVFNENDGMVKNKVKSVLKAGLTPIFCCGESLETREAGKAEKWVKDQITNGLKDLSTEEIGQIVVAYEPIWAIGTGKVCGADDANKMITMIRQVINDLSSDEVSQSIRILYGGSVKSDNFNEIVKYPNIDGGLVGGASLQADEFNKLIRIATEAQGKVTA